MPVTKSMDYEKNGRKELIFTQVSGLGPRAWLTQRANIPAGKDGARLRLMPCL